MLPTATHTPEHHEPLIQVWNGRAAVSRYVWSTPDEVTIEHAINWEELEPQAIAAVEARGGTVHHDATYPCPADLVAQGWWPEEARTA